ncbi:hypothetical protein ACVIW2_006622 [Bradyrhizobium huanghuaihaiense]|uniref:Uncharacterized protein n=1 Tax=Bradyrhizobium huanghuaihaiense TaxID=990078 RepID=A0A562RCJ4_9BRAD|nr:hypothetical protein IQ16_04934 [Bradyrhizobium huanghuaihaiense]
MIHSSSVRARVTSEEDDRSARWTGSAGEKVDIKFQPEGLVFGEAPSTLVGADGKVIKEF